MPTKKKSKPLFEIPRAIQSTPQSGWVYRSPDGRASGAGDRSPAAPTSVASILESGALSFAYGMDAAGKALILGAQLLMTPWNTAMSITRGWTKSD
ncbi:MAG: hypothetical protein ABIZ80_17135 [Bryobacteraceae bacterium]